MVLMMFSSEEEEEEAEQSVVWWGRQRLSLPFPSLHHILTLTLTTGHGQPQAAAWVAMAAGVVVAGEEKESFR